jgi:hypothetical protein
MRRHQAETARLERPTEIDLAMMDRLSRVAGGLEQRVETGPQIRRIRSMFRSRISQSLWMNRHGELEPGELER